LTSVQAYDTAAGTWITTGITDVPVSPNQGCAGAVGGVVYVVHSDNRGNPLPMMAYTESTNKWATLTVMSLPCSLTYLPTWRGKLVFADGNGLEAFNPSTQTWDPPLPLPSLPGSSGWNVAVTGTGTDLFLVTWLGGSTFVYKWVFN